jgi:hypothetical protein
VGLQPDVDTYNAVLEACESAGKVGAVQVRGTPTPMFWAVSVRKVPTAAHTYTLLGIHPSLVCG